MNKEIKEEIKEEILTLKQSIIKELIEKVKGITLFSIIMLLVIIFSKI